ncbi:MAG TPA: DUF4157 domain-containing protein [Terracidiphilus sp.]|nr:DUF4157 domain-containing protein [Terracidiphilus sp.]
MKSTATARSSSVLSPVRHGAGPEPSHPSRPIETARLSIARAVLPPNPEVIPGHPAPRLESDWPTSESDSRLALAHKALAGKSEPLDTRTRSAMESAFGRSFRHVRVHTEGESAASARSLGALAYTVGNHIVFDRGRFAPHTVSGRRLLIHEMAHVVQQDRASAAADRPLRIGSPSGPDERSADLAVDQLDRPPRLVPAFWSAQLTAMAPREPVLQRAVATWGGAWDTTQYNDHQTGGVKDGIDITLHFKPGPPVDASMISIVQKASGKKNGAALLPPEASVQARAVPAGKAGAGSFIDQLAAFRNPLYATGPGGANDKLWDTPTQAAWGQHGFHHVDGKGVVHERDAVLKDQCRIGGAGPNSEQIFEDTALAVTGAQTGANYGSVRWGWKIDAAGKFSKLPLSVLSQTVPTGSFVAAQSLWNKGSDSAGNPLIKFYSATEKFVQAKDTPLVSDPAEAAKTEIAKLDQNTRVEVIDYGVGQKFNLANPADKWVKITITDGPSSGKTGWVKASQVARTKVKANAAP